MANSQCGAPSLRIIPYPVAGALGRAPVAAYIQNMGDIVNLRRVRKAKARLQTETEAAFSRAAHGRSKAEKKLTKSEQEAAARKLDGHKHGQRKHSGRKHGEHTRDGD